MKYTTYKKASVCCLALLLSACGMFGKERLKLDGERVAVLQESKMLAPDFEAGTLKSGLIKSSIGLGTLLAEGIGDTIRVSLTENPIEEVYAGFEILKSMKLRQKGVNFISCPTCGRTQIDLINLAKKVEARFKNLDANITIATMGCAVNGPGEARHSDFGIAGGINEGYVFKKGEIIARVPENELLDKLEEVIMKSYK